MNKFSIDLFCPKNENDVIELDAMQMACHIAKHSLTKKYDRRGLAKTLKNKLWSVTDVHDCFDQDQNQIVPSHVEIHAIRLMTGKFTLVMARVVNSTVSIVC